jgi:glycosyltransferase involved in cell wall biosynthesis
VGSSVIYICVPVRDEAPTLGPILWKLRKVFTDPEFRRDFHVVVMDDASKDGTPEVLERYRAHVPLTALRSDVPLGYGGAVDRLLRHVVETCPYPKRDAAIVLQGDFTEDPASLLDLVRTFEGGADIVAAVADGAASASHRGLRWARRLAPWVLGRTHAGAPVADPLCGLRSYRVVVLKKALREEGGPLCAAAEPWTANLELLARTAPHARRVENTGVQAHPGRRLRPTRFRALPALRSLARLRGRRWDPVARGESA